MSGLQKIDFDTLNRYAPNGVRFYPQSSKGRDGTIEYHNSVGNDVADMQSANINIEIDGLGEKLSTNVFSLKNLNQLNEGIKGIMEKDKVGIWDAIKSYNDKGYYHKHFDKAEKEEDFSRLKVLSNASYGNKSFDIIMPEKDEIEDFMSNFKNKIGMLDEAASLEKMSEQANEKSREEERNDTWNQAAELKKKHFNGHHPSYYLVLMSYANYLKSVADNHREAKIVFRNDSSKQKKYTDIKQKAAEKLHSLTGGMPGEVSGVVKADEIAKKKIPQNKHKFKIANAMILLKTTSDKQWYEVIQKIREQYPEMEEEIKSLVKAAKKRKAVKSINPEQLKIIAELMMQKTES